MANIYQCVEYAHVAWLLLQVPSRTHIPSPRMNWEQESCHVPLGVQLMLPAGGLHAPLLKHVVVMLPLGVLPTGHAAEQLRPGIVVPPMVAPQSQYAVRGRRKRSGCADWVEVEHAADKCKTARHISSEKMHTVKNYGPCRC